jgi:hypothetical protein
MNVRGWYRRPARAAGLALLGGALALACPGGLPAGPINPKVYQQQFERARAKADVVAEVRTLAAACTKAEKGEGGSTKLTLELCLHVLKSEKGPARAGEILVVTHHLPNWSSRPGPPALYARMAMLRMFPCVPGAKGQVALRWSPKSRTYESIAGWVPEPPGGASPPLEAGKAAVAAGGPGAR